MTTDSGNDYGGRCPGESKCYDFAFALNDSGDGNEACGGCPFLPTKPGIAVPESDGQSDGDISADVETLVFRTGQIIADMDAGFAPNWNYYDPELSELVTVWRETEKRIEKRFAVRHQAFIKAHFEKK